MKLSIAFWAAVSLAATCAACGDTSNRSEFRADALGTMQAVGMRDIRLGPVESAWSGCGEDATFKATYSAVNAFDQPVTGRVCGDIYGGVFIPRMVAASGVALPPPDINAPLPSLPPVRRSDLTPNP
jgi:hypothetical protein